MTALGVFSTDAVSNITLAIPVVKAQVMASINTQQVILDHVFSCQEMATQFYGVRQGLCGEMMASFDAWWSSLVIMALWSLFSLPTTVYVANTLFLDLTQYQRGNDEEYVETKEEKHLDSKPSAQKSGAPTIKIDKGNKSDDGDKKGGNANSKLVLKTN